jgi:hypothetical protein
MTQIAKKLTSWDLYTSFPPGSVLETYELEDINSGIYPCYYMHCGDRLKVSTSVVSLILHSRDFHLNQGFRPPKFPLRSGQRNFAVILRRLVLPLSKVLERIKLLRSPLARIRSQISANVKTFYWNPHHSAYRSWETIDNRITKLKSFEKVSLDGNSVNFVPDFSIQCLNEIVDKASALMLRCINDLERRFPDKEHIILTGGKDSQLIALIPKLNNKKWHIFSAEPNFSLIQKWVSENNIPISNVYRHDGRNEETKGQLKRKILAGDLYTSPVHIRYSPTLKDIAEKFPQGCVFWLGTMPRGGHFFCGPGNRYDGLDVAARRDAFFGIHQKDFPAWQGNIHQTYSNLLGSPFLCPYYFEEMWVELFSHYDPAAIPKEIDLRDQIGEKLHGRKIKWINDNPGPRPYTYNLFWFDAYRYYVGYINANVGRADRPEIAL